jgi:hypothetical protein
VKFSNKCCADAWSVPSLIMSDMRAPRAGKAFNIHRIRLSAGFALFCPSMGTNKRCLWELASPKVVASAGALAWALEALSKKILRFVPQARAAAAFVFD